MYTAGTFAGDTREKRITACVSERANRMEYSEIVARRWKRNVGEKAEEATMVMAKVAVVVERCLV